MTPAIWKAEAHLDHLFGFLGGTEGGTNPVERGRGGLSLARRGSAFKERRNLTEFLAKFLFSGQLASLCLPEQVRS